MLEQFLNCSQWEAHLCAVCERLSVWEGSHVGAGEEHEEEEVSETKYYDCLSLDCAVVCQYAASVCYEYILILFFLLRIYFNIKYSFATNIF